MIIVEMLASVLIFKAIILFIQCPLIHHTVLHYRLYVDMNIMLLQRLFWNLENYVENQKSIMISLWFTSHEGSL